MIYIKKATFYLLLLILCSSCGTNEDNIAVLKHPAPSNSEFPFLYATEDSLYMSWLSHHPGDNSSSLNYARFAEDQWDSPHTISRDTSWFVNWADFPSVIAGHDGPLAAHWLDKIPGGTYAYNVNLSLADAGRNWSPAVIPHFDETATEHGFVSMAVWDEQTVLVVWLDGRQSVNTTDADYYSLDNAMTLRGALISDTGEVIESFLIDEAVCDCCQTSLVKTTEGAMVVYRDRSESEIRDIYISRFDGKSWSTPEPVHNDGWEIGACPVNGPKLAVEDSLVVVSWYTAANEQPTVKAAISTDGGTNFNDPVVVNEFLTVGRVGAAILNGAPYVSWIEKESDQTYVKARNIQALDNAPTVVGTINESRQSGFPQLAAFNGKLILAWTEVSDAPPLIKVKQYTP